MKRWWKVVLAAGLAAAGCSASPSDADVGGGGDDGGRCRSSADCDDGVPCTVDTCGVGGVCAHEPIDERCGPGESCLPGRGCVAGACVDDGDCDDAIACTLDTCGVGNTCVHEPISERCGAGMRCDVSAGCVPAGECLTAADCDDGIDCTVDECVVGYVCENTPNDARCDPGQRCLPDCGCFAFRECATDADCVDAPANFCDGTSRCDPEFGCRCPTAPRDCADSDVCTIDACDRTLEMCVHEFDCSRAECLGANPSCLWNGCFRLDRAPAQTCAMGYVNYNITEVCFELRGPSLAVVPAGVSSPAGLTLTQSPAPTGLDFDAFFENPGACVETYRLRGAFRSSGGTVDAAHFDATWTSTFTPSTPGGCLGGGCAPLTVPVVGTRL